MHKPVMGMASHTYHWNGADWRFSTEENMAAFKTSPEKYAPQYGGYCAYGVSQGHAVPIDPEAWRIVDGKLYLNYSKDVQKMWQKDTTGYIQKAEQNWPGLHK